jgi:hypothetical protein
LPFIEEKNKCSTREGKYIRLAWKILAGAETLAKEQRGRLGTVDLLIEIACFVKKL